jgi:hypothetical protein
MMDESLACKFIHPKNADESRTHLNRELITFLEGVTNRTETQAGVRTIQGTSGTKPYP